MSSTYCTCVDSSQPAVASCNDCTRICAAHGGVQSCAEQSVFGMSLAVFLVVFIIYILVLVGMIMWSIHTIKICKDNPAWLKPTIIVLLVLWIVAFPISPLIFVALVIILIIFSTQCRSKSR